MVEVAIVAAGWAFSVVFIGAMAVMDRVLPDVR